ncbi:hypothetical protein GCG54_00015327 [Colletotrichum gloeosporioides]|uniref:Uncharacterized protein n=1 Tax=Colletotrichum gloeosporioides TaxID=474922 RepID=A0A8H4FE97_COLGL|nr:uncharacterized protein GCG54_00015327 [Colletotrichum gloeosporioides]KAF3799143.1 hypothetical protein GCG54_00015327 [Colletotrichum gloeosporioides]
MGMKSKKNKKKKKKNGLGSAQLSEAETRSLVLTSDKAYVNKPASLIPTVKIVVLSQHLTLSSHYFRSQLSRLWAETLLHSKGGH